MSEWIPVTREAPPLDVSIVVSDGKTVAAGSCSACHCGTRTYKALQYENDVNLEGTITHWMRLPGPPAET